MMSTAVSRPQVTSIALSPPTPRPGSGCVPSTWTSLRLSLVLSTTLYSICAVRLEPFLSAASVIERMNESMKA